MMKYGIAIFPSKKLQDLANSYRKRYDPHYALIAPHLTLKEEFEADEDKIHSFIQKIHELANKIPSFKLSVYKVGSFHPVNNVIYLKVKEAEELTQLFESLNTGELDHERPYGFVPHITIGQCLSNEEHHDVLESLKMKDINHQEIIDRLQLLYQLENGSWTVYETFHLGKDC
jgi:2'-5' RNA ligase